jgi:hypothetical protein
LLTRSQRASPRLELGPYNRGIAEGLASGTGDEVNLGARTVALPYGPLQLDVEPAQAAQTAVHMPTAIDNMDGSHPFIKTLSSLPIAPGVEAHSITERLAHVPSVGE